MHYYLYQVTNNLNGKIYVGVHKTEDLDDGYMGSGRVICAAIKKYGIDNFSKVILETFLTSEEMFKREKEVVTEEFLVRPDTYNIRRGGDGGFDFINKNGLHHKGFESAAERNRLITQFVKGHKFGSIGGMKSVEMKKGIHDPNVPRYTQGMLGKKQSVDTKIKIGTFNSKNMTGNKNGNKQIIDSKGNIFNSVIECARFYNVSTETIRIWRKKSKL